MESWYFFGTVNEADPIQSMLQVLALVPRVPYTHISEQDLQ